MNKIEHPIQSLASLVKASIIASILAVIILLTVVLPAEYGIDPTGFGKAMGLTVMAENAEQAVKPTLGSCDERTLLLQLQKVDTKEKRIIKKPDTPQLKTKAKKAQNPN